jgi:hypothetical protein
VVWTLILLSIGLFVVEVLDAENMDHARTAGADEVIEDLKMPINFGELRRNIKVRTGALVIGLRGPAGDQINPVDKMSVAEDHKALYLAEAPVLSPGSEEEG